MDENRNERIREAIIKAYDGEFELTIEYVDGKGSATTRTVQVVEMLSSGMFRAWCKARNEFRSFYFSRVQGGFMHPKHTFSREEVKAR
jgi:predicted DNA-binding transcriptional regulator YafY